MSRRGRGSICGVCRRPMTRGAGSEWRHPTCARAAAPKRPRHRDKSAAIAHACPTCARPMRRAEGVWYCDAHGVPR